MKTTWAKKQIQICLEHVAKVFHNGGDRYDILNAESQARIAGASLKQLENNRKKHGIPLEKNTIS